VTKTKGPDNEFGPPLTTTEYHHCDEMIMAHMYGLEMMRHMNGCRASPIEQLREVDNQYPLNAHVRAILGIGLNFLKLVDDDVLTNEDWL